MIHIRDRSDPRVGVDITSSSSMETTQHESEDERDTRWMREEGIREDDNFLWIVNVLTNIANAR